MKTVAVADVFMKESFYRPCFAKHPLFDLTQVLFWGKQDRNAMRDPIHTMERGGPDAVEPPEELYEAVRDAEVLMVHLCPVNRRVIERAPKLRFILSNRGGLENIDLKAAGEHGVTVLNNPAHNANSVTELTIGLMLAETRNIARTHANLMKGVWRELYNNAGAVYELSGRTIGIYGFGNIGRRVARKLTAFDCNVLVADPFVSPDDPDLAKYGCTYVDLDTLLRESDIFTLHVRSDDLVLDRAHIEKLKPGAYFINTARPHLVDNDALYEALASGRLMGAAFDVFMKEPTDIHERYITLDNVTLTNHRGGDTVNCYADSPHMLLAEAERALRGEKPKFFANERYMK